MPEKTITNQTDATILLTLFVRQDDIPYLNNSSVTVELLPNETQTVSYGDESNPFLNGIIIFTIYENDPYSKVQFITAINTELDTLLNTNNFFSILFTEKDFTLIGSNPSNPALDQVNSVQTASENEAALRNPDVGLDLSVYNTLTATQLEEVSTAVLNNRPVDGYETVQDLQNELDTAIGALVINTNIYVQQGATGNGSRLNPFGTIEEGLSAIDQNGTVNILAGTYPITTQINVTKEGVTLKGEPGTTLLLQEDVIPFLITASNNTLEGLTITSDIPYAVEFIQVTGANTRIIGNIIFGPQQALPMDNWVVNRAIVAQGSVQNLLVENNTIYSLRTGLYVNPNVNGMITGNTIYNTKGGILIDGALIVIDGNQWDIPANDFDIVLLTGTTPGVPYDNLELLSSSNNNANISDQR